MSDVNDYYKELAARPEPNRSKLSNLQTNQAPLEEAPVDGGEGFVGSNTGPSVGFDVVEGKGGSTKTLPIWNQKSSFTDTQDNTGSTGNAIKFPGQDPTDERASYKHVQTDEDLPQTYRTSKGAGDAGASDEPDSKGGGNPDTQSIPGSSSGEHSMSDMPQTEFTSSEGGGAPMWKRGR